VPHSHCREHFSVQQGHIKPSVVGRSTVWANRSSGRPSAIFLVTEAECPVCRVEPKVHGGRACCPCSGDSYLVSSSRLEIDRKLTVGLCHGQSDGHKDLA
jgi:hypothetical protein